MWGLSRENWMAAQLEKKMAAKMVRRLESSRVVLMVAMLVEQLVAK